YRAVPGLSSGAAPPLPAEAVGYRQAAWTNRTEFAYEQTPAYEYGVGEALNPDSILGPIALDLARAYQLSGQSARALETLRWVVRREPNNARGQVDYAAELIRSGQAAQAEAPLRRALELDPQSARGWATWAVCLGRLGRADEGVAPFHRPPRAPG